MHTEKWAISGMSCAACVSRVEKALRQTPGVMEANVHLLMETAFVSYDEDTISREAIERAIQQSGYDAYWLGAQTASKPLKMKREIAFTLAQPTPPVQSGPNLRDQREQKRAREQQQSLRQRRILLVCALLSFPFLISMVVMLSGGGHWLHPWLQWLLATAIQVVGGASFYRNAWYALRSGTANMDVLITLGSSAAYLYSTWMLLFGDVHNIYFEASALIITFVLIGKWLELRARRRTTGAIERLLDLQPPSANLLEDGQPIVVAPAVVKVGQSLLVRAGERVPLDGQIISGSGTLDESILNGESMPLQKTEGMRVYAGSVNTSGSFVMMVSRTEAETMLAQMTQAVERAQATKAPVQQWADWVSGWFAWVILSVASLATLVWYFWLTPNDIGQALLVFTSILVVACPCALGLATPVAVVAGMGRAAEEGILFRDGETVQRMSRVTRIAFDKTGTLTEGMPTLEQFVVDEMSEQAKNMRLQWLQWAATIEQTSTHPLARAVVRRAHEEGIELLPLSKMTTSRDGELHGVIDGQICSLISLSNLRSKGRKLSSSLDESATRALEMGKTVSVMSLNEQAVALLVFSDRPHAQAYEMLHGLQSQGCELRIMTGDHRVAAEQCLRRIGADLQEIEINADLLPLEKQTLIDKWKHLEGNVLMVGDGINDAPALASADLGIAVRGGTDLAKQAASVVLVREQLLLVPRALQLARSTMRNIKQNLVWAFAFNALMIPLAAMGELRPEWAGFAMAASSLVVIFNALRLKRV